ncbi:hypothetical protein VTN31DRAFT_3947 [Thermomyces dupontii]|uniref:uncharacterized protein n=1 Tax=Talaromyces thermophilus TaxID=28565 RepID=UPI00374467BF
MYYLLSQSLERDQTAKEHKQHSKQANRTAPCTLLFAKKVTTTMTDLTATTVASATDTLYCDRFFLISLWHHCPQGTFSCLMSLIHRRLRGH